METTTSDKLGHQVLKESDRQLVRDSVVALFAREGALRDKRV